MRAVRRWRPYPIDEACKLYLPFYKYGSEQSKIWDISGRNNHGAITGAVPACYPILSPVNKVINGTFDADTDWTKGGGATAWTIGGGVATKVAGDAGDLEQDVSVTAGLRYRLYYYMTRTAGTLTPQLGGVNGTARTAIGMYEDIIIPTTTGNLKFQAGATFAGTVDYVYVQQVLGYEGLGWKFDLTDDKIDCGTDASALPDAFTILAWIKSSQLADATPLFSWIVDGVSPPMLSVTNAFGTGAGGVTLYLVMNAAWTNFRAWNQPSPPICNNQWRHVAVTCPGTAQASISTSQFFVGGTALTVNSTAATGAQTAKSNLVIGKASGLNMGEFILYNRVLTTQEILNHREMTRHIYGV